MAYGWKVLRILEMKGIKVLHVIDSLAPGGSERVVIEIVNQFDLGEVISSICVTRDDVFLQEKINPKIQLFCLNRKRTWDLKALRQFGKIVRENNIQLLHVHGYTSLHFVCAAKILNILYTPVLLHAHSCYPPDWKTRILGKFFVEYFLGTAPELVIWAQSLIYMNPGKIFLLGNAIDLLPFKNANSVDVSQFFDFAPRFIGIIVANVRPVKDFETLLYALDKSRYRNEIGILIVGSTDEEKYVIHLKNLIAKLNLKKQIVFLGKRNDVPDLLISADFGLLSSEKETGPIAILEYMAAGLPFISTNVGQVNELIAQVDSVSFVEPKCPEMFAKALDDLLDLPRADWKNRINVGNKVLEEFFDIRSRIQFLQQIYTNIIQARKHEE